jgi:hypothetical protein
VLSEEEQKRKSTKRENGQTVPHEEEISQGWVHSIADKNETKNLY